MASRKRKLTSAERRARRERRKNDMLTFVGGKQKWVRRPQLVDGQSVDELIANNADPLWLHMHGMWELMPIETDSDLPSHDSSVPGNEHDSADGDATVPF